jgi:apolipoprotein N-acyltransferase
VPVSAATSTRVVAPAFLPRIVVGAGAAALLALAFPPFDVLAGWAAVPALAGLIWAFRGLRPARGALLGLLTGMTFFLLLLDWMRVLGPDAWVLLTLLCASFWAGAGALLPGLLSRRWWVLTVPLLWVVMEALRERIPWGGFPWGRLAFGQADTVLVGWAALGGPAMVTFAVALAATALLVVWDALRRHRPRAGLLPVVVIGALVVGGALARGAGWGGPDGPSEQIAIVQGNVPRLGLDFNAQRRAVLDNHVRATQELALEVAAGTQAQPVAVIWPENSSDIDPLRNADAGQQIDVAADAIGAPILVGGVVINPVDPPRDDHPGTVLNVSLVWDPVTGPGESYVKRHPVPFGEYLPFRDILSRFITRFDRIPRDFAPGDEVGFLTIGPVPTGIVICFEIAYDDLVRDAVRAGGQVLVVQTNNATYGATGQPEQQLAITRVQAVASGRTALVAATSGISAVVGPDGATTWQTEEFTSDSTVTAVPMRTGLTPAMRIDGLCELIALVVLAGLVLAGRRGRRRTDPAEN